MLFNSLHFLIFLPVVLVSFYLAKGRMQAIVLLLASYYFYMAWNPFFIGLIVFSTVVDFFLGKKLHHQKSEVKRKAILFLSLGINLGLLFYFKYTNFFLETYFSLFNQEGVFQPLSIILPVGISFYTFQTLSYTIDIYRREREPEDNFINFALYVSFFPQLVAGPIERSTQLLPQLKKFTYSNNDVIEGCKLVIYGFFKKVVIADRLAVYVNNVYANPDEASALSLIVATYFFAVQIYCDFSGYTDIARGLARFFGVKLMENFKNPYFSSSIAEFWNRWHISLSTWFRDYLYIPLGGNRVTKLRNFINILIVFFVSGLWHGANWTFLIWGALHAFYFKVEKLIFPNSKEKTKGMLYIFKVLFTFHLVVLAWIFFRARSVNEALSIMSSIVLKFSITFENIKSIVLPFTYDSRSAGHFIAALIFLFIFFVLERRQFLSRDKNLFKLREYLAYMLLVLVIILFGKFNENSFIYFQF